MSEDDTLALLDIYFTRNHSSTPFFGRSREFGANLISQLPARPSSKIARWIRQNLTPLLSLQSEVGLDEHLYLQQAIRDGASLSLPIGCNGTVSHLSKSLSSFVAQAELRWELSTTQSDLQEVDISVLLSRRRTEQVCGTISGLLYQSHSARHTFWDWLSLLKSLGEVESLHMNIPLLSILDITTILNEREEFLQSYSHILPLLFDNGIRELISPHSATEYKEQLMLLLHKAFSISPSARPQMFQRLIMAIDLPSLNTSAHYLFALTSRLHCMLNRDEVIKARNVVDTGLQWATRHLSDKSMLDNIEEIAMEQLG